MYLYDFACAQRHIWLACGQTINQRDASITYGTHCHEKHSETPDESGGLRAANRLSHAHLAKGTCAFVQQH
jgi:hypothetical protein